MEKPVGSSAKERNLRMGGFAILELAVVVVIIGILLTIAMNTVPFARDKSKQRANEPFGGAGP